MKQFKKPACAVSALTLALGLGFAGSAQAANWFKLRGTEPGGTARTLQVWGFLQPTYVEDTSDRIEGLPVPGQPAGTANFNGDIPVAGTLEPDRSSQSSFFLRRARVGMRGTMTPISNDINYFVLTEWGQNGVTRGSDGAANLLDASVTFNQLSRGTDDDGNANLGARIRVGQFLFSQTSQELSRGTPVNRPHIFFTEGTDAFAIRRRTVDNGIGNFRGTGVDAARDIGIEIFDWAEFKDPFLGGGPLEFTYSVALGNGSTIGELDRDENKRAYAWLSLAKLFDETRGGRRHELMLYGWYQNGDISFNDDIDGNGVSDIGLNSDANFTSGVTASGGRTTGGKNIIRNGRQRDYRQEYFGAGVWYFDKPFKSLGQIRFEAEWQEQQGLIFDGALLPVANANNAFGGVAHDVDGKSRAWSFDLGYDIDGHLRDIGLPIEGRTTLNARWDRLDRNIGDTARGFTQQNWTFSAEYWFHPKARVTASYQVRDAEARDRATNGPTANAILKNIDDRFGIQTTLIFN